MRRWDARRARYVWDIARQGPTEVGYAFFRARRRRQNLADEEIELSESDRLVLEGDYDVDAAALAATRAVVERWEREGGREIRSLQWCLPWFHRVYGGGIYARLRFADFFGRQRGVESRLRV